MTDPNTTSDMEGERSTEVVRLKPGSNAVAIVPVYIQEGDYPAQKAQQHVQAYFDSIHRQGGVIADSFPVQISRGFNADPGVPTEVTVLRVELPVQVGGEASDTEPSEFPDPDSLSREQMRFT